MIFSPRPAKLRFPVSGFSILLLCAGILLTPLLPGCSGKKNPKATQTVKKKSAGGKPKKAPAKPAVPAVPAVFTRLTSYEGISLDKPFEYGESETLVKIDPSKGIRICTTERLPGGKLILEAGTLQIIRLETKTQYEDEKKASAAFEARKAALEKSLGLPPMQGARGVTFVEMISDGRGRSLQLIRTGSAVQEIVNARAMPRFAVPAGKPIHGLFGLTLGMPIPEKRIRRNDLIRFRPDNPRDEFADYIYYNDERGNVQSILMKSDPDRTISLAEALAVAAWLEETFAMKMSYDSENAASGMFRYSREGRVLELRRQDGKLTLSVRISIPDRKK